MISYHLTKGFDAAAYGKGFRVADTNVPARIARGMSSYTWSPCIWRDGVRKKTHFLRADWAVLDFDSGELTLAQALQLWCDCVHVIGTTRSHQKEKDGKPACDRFRVALLFERPVTDLRDYEHAVGALVELHGADPQARDGARYFFPCTQIVSISIEGYAEEWSAAPAPPDPDLALRRHKLAVYRFERYRKLPPWLERFLAHGAVVAKGRNHTAYCAARTLTELGMERGAVYTAVALAPIDTQGLRPGEIDQAIRNGIAAAGGSNG